jgi:hypothetical protein
LAGRAACPTQAIDISIPHSIYNIAIPPTLAEVAGYAERS